MREILRLIGTGRRLLLFLDYDGTLVPIRRTPDRAVLDERKRRILGKLSEKAVVCIVSGRSLADVRRIVGLKGLGYIGNHGLEASWGGRGWIHPQAVPTRPALLRLLKRIEERTRRFRRLIIEDKGLTASIHFRRMDPALVPPLKKIVDELVRRNARHFVVTEGKKVMEIRPSLDWDKGRGVRWLMRRIPSGSGSIPVFIGDDRTDEDAFRAMGPRGITIHVGRGSATQARFRFADVDDVWRFLRACLRLPRDARGKTDRPERSGPASFKAGHRERRGEKCRSSPAGNF